MASHSVRTFKFTILKILATTPRANRFNMLGGRGNASGAIEYQLGVTFEAADRRQADTAFTELLSSELIQPTFSDLVDPGNWLEITDAGRTALARNALDDLDVALLEISPQLVELRDGAWAAVASSRPDSLRQASHSARELLEQTLKTGAPDDHVKQASWFSADPTSKTGVTRRHRLRYLMELRREIVSATNLEVAEAACDFVMAAGRQLQAESHSRSSPAVAAVRDALQAVEIALRRILVQ